MSPKGLAPFIGRLLPVLQTRPEIREADLFGSRARGESTPVSDVEIAVSVDRGVPRIAASNTQRNSRQH